MNMDEAIELEGRELEVSDEWILYPPQRLHPRYDAEP